MLFIFFLVLFSWLVTRVKFFTNTGLSKPQLVILLLIKIIAGIFYGWIGTYYGSLAQMYDTWAYHGFSIQEYNLLFNDPAEYFTNLFHNSYDSGVTRFFDSSNSYWNDLKANIFIKILSVFNIFSQGHYYVNVIFYSFITLIGPISIYKVMADIFPRKKTAILLGIFLVPSFLFWTSGLQKEGLLFTGIGLVAYSLYFGGKEKKFGIRRILMLVFGILLLLALRNFVFALAIPAIIAWIAVIKWPNNVRIVFASVYLLFAFLFFTTKYISPVLDFPQSVVNKQKDFINIQGNSSVPIKELEPTVISFVKNTPQAISLSILRPYPSDVRHLLSLAAAIETDILILIFVLFLLFRLKNERSNKVDYFFIFFTFSILLAIGFSQSNLGAIVRYRSIILPLLIIPMAVRIDWKKIFNIFFNNIKKNNNVENSD